MGNRYTRKIAIIILNVNPSLKNRLKTIALNQGILESPGNLNLIAQTNPWMNQLDPNEVENMLSPGSKRYFQRFIEITNASKGVIR